MKVWLRTVGLFVLFEEIEAVACFRMSIVTVQAPWNVGFFPFISVLFHEAGTTEYTQSTAKDPAGCLTWTRRCDSDANEWFVNTHRQQSPLFRWNLHASFSVCIRLMNDLTCIWKVVMKIMPIPSQWDLCQSTNLLIFRILNIFRSCRTAPNFSLNTRREFPKA